LQQSLSLRRIGFDSAQTNARSVPPAIYRRHEEMQYNSFRSWHSVQTNARSVPPAHFPQARRTAI
ncbi:hypothetical protein, partial [Lapidilactobacillus bayanensis]|uniref:hypothetical protein n=1 Tax=Lapidilactobacillus bayanensis TaxID=2485998 RepID=UPI001CDCB080